MMASGPYATEVKASRDRAESPSTGVISSWEICLARSGGPISARQADLAADGLLAGSWDTPEW